MAHGLKYPTILKLLLPLVFGIIVGYFLELRINLFGVITAVAVAVIIGFLSVNSRGRMNGLFTLAISSVFFFIGLYLVQINNSTLNLDYFGHHSKNWNNYHIRVLEPPTEKEKSYKLVVEVLQVNDIMTCGKGLVYIKKDSLSSRIKYGDHLAINTQFGEIRANGNPKEFNYAHYLEIHDIHHQAYVKTGAWRLINSEPNSFYEWVYGLREYFGNVIRGSSMSNKNANVASALLLGQKEYLDKDILRSYSSAGAMHVLAVSGLHVGIIMMILTTLFKPIKQLRFGKNLYLLLVLIGIWVYALITGMSPSVMRAAVMFTFVVIGKELERETTIYQSILVSAFLLILLDPLIIFQVGFQLSYSAVLGIVYLQPKIENLIYVENKLIYKAWQISAVSLAAQIATFPLGLYYFHQFPNFFLVSNLLVIPLAFFILIVGVSFLALNAIPYLSDLLFWILDVMLTALNWGVEWVEGLPFSIIWGISIEWYEVFLLYITIILGSVAFINRSVKAVIVSMGLSVILLTMNVEEKMRLENQNVMCIYNVNDEVAIDLFNGRQNLFMSSEALLQDESKLLFHVKHNWYHRTGAEKPTKWMDVTNTSKFSFGNKSVSILDQELLSSGFLCVSDIVLLHDVNFVPNEILEFWTDNNIQLVIGNSVKWGAKNYIRSNFPDLKIHDLKEDGALELYV